MGRGLVTFVAAALACVSTAAEPPRPEAVAEEAATDLQRQLAERLHLAMGSGGALGAITVCRDQAPALAARTAREHGVVLGRTSHRLRNPGNTPPSWAAAAVAAGDGRKAASVPATVVDLGGRVGVLRPIATGTACLVCHGPAAGLAPEVKALLADVYPTDRAVGFEEGDLRGFIWVEVPTRAVDSGAPDGATLFAQVMPRCTVCHAAQGRGNASGPPLDGVGIRLTRGEIEAWIRTPAEMARQRGSTRKPAMVPYPELSDEELDVLVDWLASLPPLSQRN